MTTIRQRDSVSGVLPPGPRWSRRTQGHQLYTRPHVVLRACARRFGDVFTLRPPRTPAPVIVVSQPRHVRAMIEADENVLDRSTVYQAFFSFRHSMLMCITGRRRQYLRSILGALLDVAAVEIGREDMRQVIDKLIDDAAGAGCCEMGRLAESIARRITLALFFGPELAQPLANELEGAQHSFAPGAGQPLFSTPLSQFVLLPRTAWRAQATLRGFGRAAAEWMVAPPTTPLARRYQQLVSRRSNEHQLDTPPTLGEVAGMLMLTWGASTSTLENILFHTVREDAARRRLEQELSGRTASEQAGEAAGEFLMAFGKEVRRMSPSTIGFMRIVRSPFCIDGWELLPETRLMACSYLAHRNAAVFENPTAFQPERFLGRTYAPHDYFPFGTGSFQCLGQRYLAALGAVVVGSFVGRYDVLGVTGQHNRVAHTVVITRRARPIRARLRRSQLADRSPLVLEAAGA